VAKNNKNKNEVLKLFLINFLKGTVVILGIVIVLLGAYLGREIYTGWDQRKNAVEPDSGVFTESQIDELLTATPTEPFTESLYVEGPAEVNYGLSIKVLNATETSGLAGSWRDKLYALGYTNVSLGDSNEMYETTKILVTEEKMADELRDVFPYADYEVGNVPEGAVNGPIEGVNVFIFLGNDSIPQSEE
jgi:hypothetical protein